MLAEEKKIISSKRRIYRVAKEFSVSNEALMEFLLEHKFKVRNHMAPVTDEMFELICQNFQKVDVDVEAEPDFRKKIQEKKREEEARKEAIRQEIDDILEYAKGDIYEALKKPEKKVVKKVKTAEISVKAKVEEKTAEEKPEVVGKTELESKPEVVAESAAELQLEKGAETSEKTPEQSEEHKKEKQAADEKDKPKRHLKRRPATESDTDETTVDSEKDKSKKRKKKDRKAEPAAQVEVTTASKKKRRKKKKKKPAVQIDEKEIEASIKETLAKMSDAPKRRKRKKERDDDDVLEEAGSVIKTTEFCSVSELANLMDVEPSEIISSCIGLGLMVSINQRLEKDTLIMVADEFGYEVEFQSEYGESMIVEEEEEVDDPEQLEHRPPVVTIMGHVDHGKTSLLDYIRESNVIAGEAGGITQHIGAYEVSFKDKQITFLDTPGHEAFTAMRARGAQATDIVVLVVAADDNVMPQTIEAINHANAAGVPMVVAVNKIDKPNANPDNIKKQLSGHDVLIEDWGGKVQAAEVSAKTGEGIEHLLELILLEAEILELKANPHAQAKGVLVEVKMEKGRGTVSTVLVQRGTMQVGDIFVAGSYNGRVRAMFDERNNPVTSAPPSTPVQILGFTGSPQAGDKMIVVKTEQEAREISVKRQQLKREHSFRQQRRLTLDQISKMIAEGEVKELPIVIKADVDGSVEALSDSIMELCCEDVGVRIIHKGVGAITETDVYLAEASRAVIIGFHVTPTTQARELAAKEEIDIRLYKVIYDVVNDVKLALSGLLEPEVSEEVIGEIEIRDIFKASKIGSIAGCYVTSGNVHRNDKVRLVRDGKPVYDGKFSSLKRFKDDVKEVASGYECGLTLENYNDVKVGDKIEVYKLVETARSLE